MQIEETQVTIVKLTAEPGKTFARKEDGGILSPELWLGKEDRPESYAEVDIPPAEAVPPSAEEESPLGREGGTGHAFVGNTIE